MPSTGWPSMAMMRSPGWSPAASAGLSPSDPHDPHARRLLDAGMPRDMAGNDRLLAFDAERRPPHPAMLQDLRQHMERGIAGDRKADALGAQE